MAATNHNDANEKPLTGLWRRNPDTPEAGLAIRVCCKGEQGHTGATYIAYSILKKLNQIMASESEQKAPDRSVPTDLQTLTATEQ